MTRKSYYTPFYFKDLSHESMADLLDERYPIKLKYNEDLINRVAARYPLIDKIKVTLIVKTFFQAIRNLLILGKVLSFQEIFIRTKFIFFPHWRGEKLYPSVKIKMTTQRNFK